MIFNNYDSFCDRINNICEDECEDLYIIMRSGYSMNDILDSDYNMELLEYDSGEHVWLHDWYEGQNFIEIYDYYRESEVLHKLLHLQHRKGLEDYID